MRRRRWPKIIVAIYVVWIALTVGERWPFHHIFDVPPEFRQDIVFSDVSYGPRADISPREAHLLWVIRDPELADGTFDVFARNFGAMLRRASPLELPVVIPLDIITLVFGESFILIRLIALTALGVILTMVAYGVWRCLQWLHKRPRWVRITCVIFLCAVSCHGLNLFAGSLLLNTSSGSTDAVESAVNKYMSERTPGEPVITLFGDSTRLAHFEATMDLATGNRIDLSDRVFSAQEIEAIVSRQGEERFWLLFERSDPYLDDNLTAAIEVLEASGRTRVFCRAPTWLMRIWKNGAMTLISSTEMSDFWLIYSYEIAPAPPAESSEQSPRGCTYFVVY